MTYDGELGVYTYTFENVPAANYQFKIAINGSWDENYGMGGARDGANYSVTVPETMDVTVYYSHKTHLAVTNVDYQFVSPVISGTGIADTALADPGLTGIYSGTVTMATGIYTDVQILCGEAVYTFAEIIVYADKDVTFYLDPVTGIFYCDASNIPVDDDSITFDSQDETYKAPFGAVAENEEVTFAIATGEDVTSAVLVIKGLGSYPMTKSDSLWDVTISIPYKGEYDYYFVLSNGSNVAVYGDDDGYYGTGCVTDLTSVMPYDLVVYPEEAFYAMMNLVGSHDTTRILSYLDGIGDDRNQKDFASAFPTYEGTSQLAKERQHLVAFLQFTYAGAPTIYYGDEIGMVGSDDPDDRRAFEWGKGNRELVEYYARLAAIRNAYPELRTGSVEPVDTENLAPAYDPAYIVGAEQPEEPEVLASGWSGYTTWVLTSDGTITFTSSGETMDNGESNMKNYWKVDGVLTLPWGEYAEQITKVVIEEGIHDIGQMAFYQLPNLVEVVLPESAVEIRNYAFKNCTNLTTINLEVVEFIREGAFYGCSALENITFAEGVVIEDWAFSKTPVVLS